MYKEDYTMRKEPKDLLHIIISSVLMVDAIRLLIMKGEINHKEVVFRFEGRDLEVDKNGMLRVWPKGFCNIYDDILEELLDRNMGDNTRRLQNRMKKAEISCKHEHWVAAGYPENIYGKEYVKAQSIYHVFCLECENFVNLLTNETINDKGLIVDRR